MKLAGALRWFMGPRHRSILNEHGVLMGWPGRTAPSVTSRARLLVSPEMVESPTQNSLLSKNVSQTLSSWWKSASTVSFGLYI